MKSVPTREGSAALLNRKTRRKKDVNNNCGKKFWGGTGAGILRGWLAALAVGSLRHSLFARKPRQKRKNQVWLDSKPDDTRPDHATGGNLCIPAGSRSRHTGICLPAQPSRRRILDRQQCSPRRNSLPAHFRRTGTDHHPLPEPGGESE